ncbi:MAG: DegV family protein [Candidatus Dormibacteraeota bacterium]|uniref:DegV family protein n=1 Tax=Candidatus Amunia macphersoniae TaxID=3127014 RepID=A0A934NIX7_9BACT|nr:DegV family protein [Candidatus Dormibacteraeota bacterium]
MIRVVTDSTSDLVPADAARLGVDVVPLTVRFGDEQFLDAVELSADQFYSRLPDTPVQPSTSQPTPEQFAEVYRRHVAAGDSVVSVHISSKLSGTIQSASLAAQEFPDGAVRVVDSTTVSAGIQFLVRAALDDIAAGAGHDHVVGQMEQRRDRIVVYVLLDSLTYLQRGGRIGRAQGLLGGILKVKPLLRISEGEVHPEARVRSRQQGISKMVEMAAAQRPLEALGFFHCGAPELLALIEPRLRHDHPDVPMFSGQLGAVVGTYSGPGGVGVGLLRAG